MVSILKEDPGLLKMLVNSLEVSKGVYNPGPFWNKKAKKSAKEMLKTGISDFRSNDNLVGRSFSDSEITDVSTFKKNRIILFLAKLLRVNKLLDSQRRYTRRHIKTRIEVQNVFLKQSLVFKELLNKYVVPDNSTLFGCSQYLQLESGILLSHHYITLLHRHSIIDKHIEFHRIYSMMEIGGGFGTNIHLLLASYPSVRKIIYLDIVPNLYVGTQYLKFFYGEAVIDFKATSRMEKIRFKDNNDLEIICITPYQIEMLDVRLDYFHNANSFTEMTKEIVTNYVQYILKLLKADGQIGLVSYDGNQGFTIAPNEIPKLFGGNFISERHARLIEPSYYEYYFIKK